ncbi:hypothetical protein P1A145kb_p082 [Pectobacterium phage DU_PP_I]|nr:hypothetical protein P1A145kb_p082 [Pectobacterium phage DU_PP_I]ATS93799.1 hypothetical protein P12B145kb_p083 [Pectobacterium phage DU_PP_IV]
MVKLVKGFGINDSAIPVQRFRRDGGKVIREWTDPIYLCWYNMLARQTQEWKDKYPSYEGVFVSEQWKNFSAFQGWVWFQLKGQELSGYDLDKDILFPGNREYGPGMCVFLPSFLNKVIARIGTTEYTGTRPRGKSFSAQIMSEGKKLHLGTFSTKESAHAAWQGAKVKELSRVRGLYAKDPLADDRVTKRIEEVIDNIKADLYRGRATKKLFKETT